MIVRLSAVRSNKLSDEAHPDSSVGRGAWVNYTQGYELPTRSKYLRVRVNELLICEFKCLADNLVHVNMFKPTKSRQPFAFIDHWRIQEGQRSWSASGQSVLVKDTAAGQTGI